MATTTHKFDTSKMPKQRAFMESLAGEILFSGAVGAGKSRVGCEKGLLLSLMYPGNKGLIVRKTYTSLKDTTMWTWQNEVCPPELIKHASYSFNQTPNKCTLVNNSQILFSGLEHPMKIGSLQLGWVFYDEVIEADEEDWMMLLGRLRHKIIIDDIGVRRLLPVRQIFAATNPGNPSHWLYNRAFESFKDDGTPVMEVFQSNSIENIHNPDDFVSEKLASHKGIYRDRYVLGKWVGAEGVVYDCFDPSKHIIEEFEIPGDWSRYRTIDFGYTNPFACLWIAQHPDMDDDPGNQCTCPLPNHKGFVVYREIYMSGRVVEDHAWDINRLTKEYIGATFTDWNAEGRAVLELNGIPTTQAEKAISSGIQMLYNLIASDMMFFFKDAVRLVERDETLKDEKSRKRPQSTTEEMFSYKYLAKQNKERNDREEPQDRDNHGLDALRYLAYSLHVLPRYSFPLVAGTKKSTFLSPATGGWGGEYLETNFNRVSGQTERPHWGSLR